MSISNFTIEVRRGRSPSERDWEGHLIDAHARDPRMTPDAFAPFRTSDGFNSYQILATEVLESQRDVKVVDLACGDGHLIPYLLSRLTSGSKVVGVDMAPEGLELAREQIRDPRVSFLLARAQEVPLSDASVDHVLCHLAFMLMSPLKDVVDEIRRVLKSAGTFTAVVGGGEARGLFKKMQRLNSLFVQAHAPGLHGARVGSGAAGNRDGWCSLFNVGFSDEILIREFHLDYHVPPEGLWDYVRGMYFAPILPESARRELRDELAALARDHVDSAGRIQFHVPMRLLKVRRL